MSGVKISGKQDKSKIPDLQWFNVRSYASKLGVKSWTPIIKQRFFMRRSGWWQLVRGTQQLVCIVRSSIQFLLS